MTKSTRCRSFVLIGAIVVIAIGFTCLLRASDHVGEDGRHGVEPVQTAGAFVPQRSASVRESTFRELDKTPTRRSREVSLWRAHVDALDQLSAKGDVAASIQLYQEAANCDHFHRAMHSVLSDLENDQPYRADLSAEDMSVELDNVERRTARLHLAVRDYESLCEGSDKVEVTMRFKELTFRAAEQGYLPAQACYLAKTSRLHLTSSDSSQSVDANRYRQYAATFYSNALQHAYFPLVINATFRWIAMPRDYQSFQDLLPPPDAYLTWRALRVVYYRVDESQRVIATRWLQALSEKGRLSGEDEIRGDDWARDFVAASPELGQPLKIEVPRPMCPLE